MTYVLCVGESLIDFIAQAGIGDVGASEFFQRAAGGAVSNVAVGIARLGGSARFAGSLSRDSFGKYLLRMLARENVGIDDVRMVDAATTLAFVARGNHGERDFVFVRNPGADSLLEHADINEHSITRARALHFGGVLLATEPARAACLAAARSARLHEVLVSFDPNARPTLFASAELMVQVLLEGCAAAHLVKLSDEDLHHLNLSADDPSALFNEVTQAIVITRGERACSWHLRSGESGSALPPRIDPVDTTGAGDASMAAMLWRLLWSHDGELTPASLGDAVRHACAAGAFKCLHEGAVPSMPTADDVSSMLAQVGS